MGYYVALGIFTVVCFIISIVLIIIGSHTKPPKQYNIKTKGVVVRIDRDKYGNERPIFQHHYYNDSIDISSIKNAVPDCELRVGDRIDIYLLYNNRSYCWYYREYAHKNLKTYGLVTMMAAFIIDILGVALIHIFTL